MNAIDTNIVVYPHDAANSDNNLENLRLLDQTWKVCIIEEEFKRLLFEVQDS